MVSYFSKTFMASDWSNGTIVLQLSLCDRSVDVLTSSRSGGGGGCGVMVVEVVVEVWWWRW